MDEDLKKQNVNLANALEELTAAEEEIGQQNMLLREAQTALEEERFRYSDLFENAPDAYLVTDANGIIKELNRAARKILRADVDGAVGKPLALFVPGEERDAFRMGLLHAGRQERVEEWEMRLRPKGGLLFDVSISLVSVRDRAGSPSLRWLIRDISRRKRAEDALQKSERHMRILSTRLLRAQEEERKRVAKELHDGMGSSLSAIKFGLERALQDTSGGKWRLELLETLVSTTGQAIEEVRRIMADLRPSVLDDLGIVPTINWFCRQFRTIHPETAVEQQLEIEEREVPEVLKIVIFRIMQEAFQNVAKHGRAKIVRIGLQNSGNRIELRIEDDGVGFDSSANSARKAWEAGMGLSSMKERTELSGGRFEVRSEKGKGTTLRASWGKE